MLLSCGFISFWFWFVYAIWIEWNGKKLFNKNQSTNTQKIRKKNESKWMDRVNPFPIA